MNAARGAPVYTTARMRHTALVALAASLVLSLAPRARAQDAAAVAQVRQLESCVREHMAHLERLVRLIEAAQARTSSSDEAVRRDAVTTIDTLVGRAHEVREHLRHCVDQAHIPRHEHTEVTHEEAPPEGAEGSVATAGGTVHEVEAGTELSTHVRVVRGERVDGHGSASDAQIRTAMRGIASRLEACYEGYADRASAAQGELHLVFTVADGGRVTGVEVERGRSFDAELRACVQRAGGALSVGTARGQSVYSYQLRFGAE